MMAEPEVEAAPEPQQESAYEEEPLAPPKKQSKSDKQYAKREALLAKITAGANPYSKSHTRRMKRAARPSENLVTGLGEVEDVLQQVTAQAEEERAQEEEEMDQGQAKGSWKELGGKGQPKLTVKKRNKVLTEESARLPAVLANPAFASNPFATIRTHTLNNLALINKAEAEKKAKAKAQAKAKAK
ncbi:ribosome biogenesis protein SLX9-domain-containing protein [Leucosporidium creatinivorum]|uniref:Ribosome biogenesis protein SLX9 n=1 Tax=Leucosporidium creatinivorum TaxID=106004 RepID=A0A1Y2G2B4_9BASI|nr:ribosome biogenesis protein SLX9-domain-containing protein [Leucosporidium creatinivorum]